MPLHRHRRSVAERLSRGHRHGCRGQMESEPGGKGVSHEKNSDLAARSDELLDALRRLKDTERQKRHEPISSEDFHSLANEVDAISHEVFSIARDQRQIGDETPSSDETIEEVQEEQKGA